MRSCAVGRADQLRREVLRRPAGQVDVHVRLVRGDRDLRVHPRHRGVRHHDRQLGEVGGDVVEQHRVGVPQLDAVAARQPRADAGLAGVEQRGQAGIGDRGVDRVVGAVVGLEALQAGVELEALDAQLDLLVHTVHGRVAGQRVDGAERDQHVVVARRARDQVLDGVGRDARTPSARRW